jgi:hypothetical protein
MTIETKIENNWKILLYGGAVVTFITTGIIVYFTSTLPNTEKNGVFMNLIIVFCVFFVLFFLTVEVYDIHMKLKVLMSKKSK